MTLEEFKKRFSELRAEGFLQSLRKGPTGVGYTFETLMGIEENNLALPDIDEIEIKTHREGVSSMITLFTFNKKAWKMKPLEAVKKYGSKDKNGRVGLYYTMSRTPNGAGLFLDISKGVVAVRHVSGEVVVSWTLDGIATQFQKKLPALLFISAKTEERGGFEYFHFYRARLMSGTTPELLGDLIANGDILVDLRLHDKGTMARNHGTGFRTYEGILPKLFNNITDI